MRNLDAKFSIRISRKHVLTSLFDWRDPWNGSPTSEPFCFVGQRAHVVARVPHPSLLLARVGFHKSLHNMGCYAACFCLVLAAFFAARFRPA